MQSERLKVACALPEASTLTGELLAFRGVFLHNKNVTLDLTNPTVQVAIIAGVVALTTGLLTFFAALLNFFSGVVYRRHDARLKREERLQERRSKNAEHLLSKIVEYQSRVNWYIERVEEAKHEFRVLGRLVQNIEDSGERNQAFDAAYKAVMKQNLKSSITGEVNREELGNIAKQTTNWFSFEALHWLLWFENPERFIDDFRRLGETYRLLYLHLDQALFVLGNVETDLLTEKFFLSEQGLILTTLQNVLMPDDKASERTSLFELTVKLQKQVIPYLG